MKGQCKDSKIMEFTVEVIVVFFLGFITYKGLRALYCKLQKEMCV